MEVALREVSEKKKSNVLERQEMSSSACLIKRDSFLFPNQQLAASLLVDIFCGQFKISQTS